MFSEQVAALPDSGLLAMKETVETYFKTIESSKELHSVAKKLVAEAVSEVTGDGTRVQNELDSASSKINIRGLGFFVGTLVLAIALTTAFAKGCG